MIFQSINFPDLWTSRKPLSVKIQISRVEGSCQRPFQSWFLLCFSRPTWYSFTIMSLQRNRCVRCWREEFFLGFTVLLVIGMCLRVDGNQNTIRPQAAQFRAKVQIVLVVIILVKTSVWPQSSSCEILPTGLPTDAFDAGSTTASSFAGERVGIVVNVFSIAFTVIGRWYQKMATGGRRFVCRGPSLQNEAAPSLAGQISQSSEAQVRSKTVKNIGQITLWYTNSCTTWVDKNLAICGVFFTYFLTMSSNCAGFCPSTRSTFAGTPWGYGWGWWGDWRSVQCLAQRRFGWSDSGIRMHPFEFLPYAGAAEKSGRYNTDVVMYQITLLYHLCALFMSHVWLWFYVYSHISVMCVLFAIIMNHTSCLYDTGAIISNINHTYNTEHAVFWMRLCTVCDITWCTAWKRSSRWTFLYSSISKSIVSANSLPNPLNRYVATYIVQALKDA